MDLKQEGIVVRPKPWKLPESFVPARIMKTEAKLSTRINLLALPSGQPKARDQHFTTRQSKWSYTNDARKGRIDCKKSVHQYPRVL